MKLQNPVVVVVTEVEIAVTIVVETDAEAAVDTEAVEIDVTIEVETEVAEIDVTIEVENDVKVATMVAHRAENTRAAMTEGHNVVVRENPVDGVQKRTSVVHVVAEITRGVFI